MHTWVLRRRLRGRYHAVSRRTTHACFVLCFSATVNSESRRGGWEAERATDSRQRVVAEAGSAILRGREDVSSRRLTLHLSQLLPTSSTVSKGQEFDVDKVSEVSYVGLIKICLFCAVLLRRQITEITTAPLYVGRFPPPKKRRVCRFLFETVFWQSSCSAKVRHRHDECRQNTHISLSSLWAMSSFSRASPHPLTISSTVSQGTLSMCLITGYSVWSQVYVCRPIRSFCSCVSCFMFNVGPTAWLCFMSDILFYWFTDWLHCIDLFRCIAASLFSKLTYLLAFYVCKVITAAISCIDTD